MAVTKEFYVAFEDVPTRHKSVEREEEKESMRGKGKEGGVRENEREGERREGRKRA